MLSFAEKAILHRKGKIAFCLQSDDAHAHRLIQILKTAAKRRKGAGNEVPCWGLGQSPNRIPSVLSQNSDLRLQMNAELLKDALLHLTHQL